MRHRGPVDTLTTEMFGLASAFLGSGKSNVEEDGTKRKAEDEICGDKAKMARVVENTSGGGSQDDINEIVERSQEDAVHGKSEQVGAKESPSDTVGNVNGGADSATEDDDEPTDGGNNETQMEDNDGADNVRENPYDKLRYCIIENDGKPDSCVKLIGLKSLFAKQLPKMPRSYIARLVFERRHTSLAILSDDPQHKGTDDEIIGAICYRGFREMRFAEIAFCAVNSSHQVKVRTRCIACKCTNLFFYCKNVIFSS